MAALLIVVVVVIVAAVILVRRGLLPPPSTWWQDRSRPSPLHPRRDEPRQGSVPRLAVPSHRETCAPEDAYEDPYEDAGQDTYEDLGQGAYEDVYDESVADEAASYEPIQDEAILQGAVDEWPPEPVADDVVWDEVEGVAFADEPYLEPVAAVDAAVDVEPVLAESEPAELADAAPGAADGSMLARRTPKEAGVPSRPMRLGGSGARPAPQTRRSPTEVRSLLSSYRGGLQKGRDSEDPD